MPKATKIILVWLGLSLLLFLYSLRGFPDGNTHTFGVEDSTIAVVAYISIILSLIATVCYYLARFLRFVYGKFKG